MHVSNYINSPPVRLPGPIPNWEQRIQQRNEAWQNTINSADSDSVQISDKAQYLSNLYQSPPDLKDEMKPWYFRGATDFNYELAESKASEIKNEAAELGLNLDFKNVLTQIMTANGIRGPEVKYPDNNPITDAPGNLKVTRFVTREAMLNDGEKEKMERLYKHASDNNVNTDIVSDISTKYAMDKTSQGKAAPHLDANYFDTIMKHRNEWSPGYKPDSGIERLRSLFANNWV